MSTQAIFSLDSGPYEQHEFHRCERDWLESNCYIDVYIEVLNALKLDAHACLSFTLASGFEGDQWTFFKPQLAELKSLYGLTINELTLWKPLSQHVVEQVGRGRIVVPEVDAFYLPDTRSTDYRQSHVKTTIAVSRIDEKQKLMGYFHNAGYYELCGDDFDGVFRIDVPSPPDYLPPYCEFIKLDNLVHRSRQELCSLALRSARDQLRHRPANPFEAYSDSIAADVDWLITQDERTYHNYVFAGLRQCGANFEFAAYFVDWLQAHSELDLQRSVDGFREISSTAKMLILKIARIARSKQPRDLAPSISQMATAWETAMGHLDTRLME